MDSAREVALMTLVHDHDRQTSATKSQQRVAANDRHEDRARPTGDVFASLYPCNPAQTRLDLQRVKPRVTVGRSPANDVVLGAGSIKPSGQIHAEIIWDKKSDLTSCVLIRDKNSTNGTYVNGIRLKSGTYRILKQGNEISFGSEYDNRYIFHNLAAGFCSNEKDLYAQYDLGPELGRGSFGIAYKAISRTTGKWYAIKMITLERSDAERHEDTIYLQREIAIMRKFKHPNICELVDVFIQDREIDLVLELVEGGDLMTYIEQERITSEYVAKYITYQICDALAVTGLFQHRIPTYH
ncbi:hypothetical protein V5O48_006218 [Marasmius crinis-equi]|uniref:Uncharacterized protein n=1 Tax=Marasmius crinis-equi TaxID=585013 RepID=A0ABR3FL03_9AGAR